MLKIVVIGSGNVAQHLIKAIEASGAATLVQAYARHPEKLAHLLEEERIVSSFDAIADAEIYLLSVTDDAISDVASQLPFEGRLVAHTSGSVAMTATDAKNRRAVFYPLQTFSKAKKVDFSTIPICLESENEEDYTTLEQLARSLSQSVYRIDSQQRQAIHVAAVFVSNFTNHMYALGDAVCRENSIPFDILKPLITETADKINTLPPAEAQTGPAVRHDQKTIEKHIGFLKEENLKNIYTLLTQSIQKTNG